MTVAEFVALGTSRLASVSSTPALDAQMLAAHVLRVDRSYLLAHPEEELPELAMEVLLQRREAGEPLVYILGWREFYGRRFAVRQGVLIPRQETEVVVETCLALDGIRTVLDMGTGSGIIAITLAVEKPGWRVFAADISTDALQIARENANSLGAQVEFSESDLFASYEAMKFDLIVSNPPYIGTGEGLPTEVKDYEPAKALYSGETGDEIYERLAKETPQHLTSTGKLIMELGYRSLPSVSRLLLDNGWKIDQVVKDLSGIDRCIVAEHPYQKTEQDH